MKANSRPGETYPYERGKGARREEQSQSLIIYLFFCRRYFSWIVGCKKT